MSPEALGLDVNVFIHVSLEKQVEQSLHRFEEEIAERPEVMECYLMTGDPDYLLRVLLPSIQALERFTRLPDAVAGGGQYSLEFCLEAGAVQDCAALAGQWLDVVAVTLKQRQAAPLSAD